jgi:hypothetical protein
MFKGFMFFALGLLCLMGVVGGIENTIELGIYDVIQLTVVTLLGFSCMVIGVSYLNEGE